MQAHLNDIMPSILKWFHLPIPGYVEGKPLPCLTAFPSIRQDVGALALAGPHRSEFEYSEEEQRLIEQRLADLGYLA